MKIFRNISLSVLAVLLSPISFLFIRSRRKSRLLYLLPFVLLLFSGCFLNFYKTNTKPQLDEATIYALKSKDKYFIVHLKDGNYALKNLKVDNDLIEGDIGPIEHEHSRYLDPCAQHIANLQKKGRRNALRDPYLRTR